MFPARQDHRRSATGLALLVSTGILFSLLLAGCSAADTANNSPSPTSPSTVQPTSVPTPTIVPNCIPASPDTSSSGVIAPQGWATFSDNIAHYTIKYPANWIVFPGACAGSELDVYNYDPRHGTGGSGFPPGGIKIISRPLPNPSQLSARDFFKMVLQQNLPGSTCPLSAAQDVTIAGRNALAVTCPDVPGYTYYMPDGVMMLVLAQSALQNGEPSPIFTQMAASITFTAS
jgi:hypothetical protein